MSRWWLHPILWIYSLAKHVILLFFHEGISEIERTCTWLPGAVLFTSPMNMPQIHFQLSSGCLDAGKARRGKPRERKKAQKSEGILDLELGLGAWNCPFTFPLRSKNWLCFQESQGDKKAGERGSERDVRKLLLAAWDEEGREAVIS